MLPDNQTGKREDLETKLSCFGSEYKASGGAFHSFYRLDRWKPYFS